MALRIRGMRSFALILCLLVTACDKRHNLGALVADLRTHGPGYLDHFNADKEDQVWYFENVLKAMEGMDGHDTSSLYRGVGDPGEYLIVSRWSDQGAFDAFIASDRFKKVADWGAENILAGRPSHTTYRET